MNIKIHVRRALKEDLKDIYALVVGLAIFEREPEAVTSTLHDYEEAFDQGLIHASVAEVDDVIVGMSLYYFTFSTWKGKMLYLEDFYVSETYRSAGIGQKLYDDYIAFAHETSCKMVKWQVLDWNENAIKFYVKNGATVEKIWWNCKIIF